MQLEGTWFKMDSEKKRAVKVFCVQTGKSLSEFIADAVYAAYLNETAPMVKGTDNETQDDEHESHHV